MPKSKTYILSLAVALFSIVATGCQNRCCNRPFGGGFTPFNTAATTVPSPTTYSLQVPQTARQQDYYTVPAGGANRPTPTGTIPNYNNTQPNLSPQPGWRQQSPGVGSNNGLNPTSFSVVNQPGAQVASGTAQTLNPNYATTVVDERNDASRMAVTDASQVRAPARFFPTGNMGRLSTTPVATTAAAVPVPTGNRFPNQLVNNNQRVPAQFNSGSPTAINGSFEVHSQPTVVANNYNYGVNPYQANQANQVAYNQPGVQARSFNRPVTSSTPTVLAQSTTERANVANNTQVGWRDSQVYSAQNPNLNR